MLGVGVNSNAGLIGNITLDEQNFDWRRWPTSWEDIRNATAWRGGGQQFRIQASPGTVYQQYSINFHNPYLFDTPISFGLGGSSTSRVSTTTGKNNAWGLASAWVISSSSTRTCRRQCRSAPRTSTSRTRPSQRRRNWSRCWATTPSIWQMGNHSRHAQQLVPGHPRAPHRHRPRAGLRQLCLPACHDQRVATFPAARAAGHVGSANLEL